MSLETICKELCIHPPARSEAIADLERVIAALLERVKLLEQKVAELEKR